MNYEEFCTEVTSIGTASNAADDIESAIKSLATDEVWQLVLQLEEVRLAELGEMTAKAFKLYQSK